MFNIIKRPTFAGQNEYQEWDNKKIHSSFQWQAGDVQIGKIFIAEVIIYKFLNSIKGIIKYFKFETIINLLLKSIAEAVTLW